VNDADTELCDTVTDAGTVAAEVSELANVTATPPEGAEAFNVTVPPTFVPPGTLVELSVKLNTAGAIEMVSGVEKVALP
jgi:hypothetical protein